MTCNRNTLTFNCINSINFHRMVICVKHHIPEEYKFQGSESLPYRIFCNRSINNYKTMRTDLYQRNKVEDNSLDLWVRGKFRKASELKSWHLRWNLKGGFARLQRWQEASQAKKRVCKMLQMWKNVYLRNREKSLGAAEGIARKILELDRLLEGEFSVTCLIL